MKIAKLGTDYIVLDENNYQHEAPQNKVHIIKLNFVNPTSDVINDVLRRFQNTNRYVISDNIRFYNNILKNTSKKYYVENNQYDSNHIITFLRRNNKILLNFNNLNSSVKSFLFENLQDVLNNVEVCRTYSEEYTKHKEIFDKWSGNLILDRVE